MPLHRQGRNMTFVTDVLNEMRMLALSSGGCGLSEKGRKYFYKSTLLAEKAAMRATTQALAASQESGEADAVRRLSESRDGEGAARSGALKEGADERGVVAPVAPTEGLGKRARVLAQRKVRKLARRETARRRQPVRSLESAFPSAEYFVASLNGEADRCLAEQKWRVTDSVEGGKVYPFNNRCVMELAHEVFQRAEKLELLGERRYEADGSRVWTNSLDSDIVMHEQHDVLERHKTETRPEFVMATQLFSDASFVSWNGGSFCPRSTNG